MAFWVRKHFGTFEIQAPDSKCSRVNAARLPEAYELWGASKGAAAAPATKIVIFRAKRFFRELAL